jgi:hypothetical protein
VLRSVLEFTDKSCDDDITLLGIEYTGDAAKADAA